MFDLAARVAALTGGAPGPDEPFAVAVSGGPDSLALLLLAHAAFGARLRCLTVDHGLRSGSAAEAGQVSAICAGLGVPHVTLRWDGEKPVSNIHAAARAARYNLMSGWCAANGVAWLATAHHADDQAETLLMRLARGAGPGGLTGIRPTRPLGDGVTLLRPLIGARRAELRAVVDTAGLTAIDDPANADPRYDRTRARALLVATPWLDASRLAAAAAHLGDSEAALQWTADTAWRGRAALGEGSVELDAAGLPRELARRLTLRALAVFGGDPPRGPELDRLIARLEAGSVATLGGVRAASGPVWRFTKSAPRRRGSSG